MNPSDIFQDNKDGDVNRVKKILALLENPEDSLEELSSLVDYYSGHLKKPYPQENYLHLAGYFYE